MLNNDLVLSSNVCVCVFLCVCVCVGGGRGGWWHLTTELDRKSTVVLSISLCSNFWLNDCEIVLEGLLKIHVIRVIPCICGHESQNLSFLNKYYLNICWNLCLYESSFVKIHDFWQKRG